MVIKVKDIDEIQKNLKIILKHGDLYDAISLKENVKPQSKMLIKANILFLSRILYCGIIIFDKVEAHFAPIEKVKDAQDKIRTKLGVNIDILRTKNEWNLEKKLPTPKFRHDLYVLYENTNVEMTEYINHLQKIVNFCELYKINQILLNKSDIIDKFHEVDFSIFKDIRKNTIFDNKFIKDEENELYLFLTRSDLLKLIDMLKVVTIDMKILMNFKRKISDLSVKNAIIDFYINGDIEKLKNIVTSRLALNINSDNTYKDKIYGKIIENIEISGKYVKVITKNNKGELITNNIMTLYNYLGIADYDSLLKQIENKSDNQELFLLSALHLYLCQFKKIKHISKNSISFYDQIYQDFKAKKAGKIKKIPGLNTKLSKLLNNLMSIGLAWYVYLIIYFFYIITGVSLDLIQKFVFNNDNSNILHDMIEKVNLVYQYSYNLEGQILTKAFDIVEELGEKISDLNNNISFSGDVNFGKEKTIATVTPLQNVNMPEYYANGYATSATYESGKMIYKLEQPQISYNSFQNAEPLFDIEIEISRSTLKKAIENNELNIKQMLYPLGDNYVLTNLCIKDEKDETKIFRLDATRALTTKNFITDEEKNILLAMKKPTVCFSYGISNINENSFISDVKKEEPYSLLPNEVKDAITTGLNLDKDASLIDIFYAIKSKEYSFTPIKDAGLTRKIKKMSEMEYIETISSLDSLNCNLAATLAIISDDELIYTSGYYNNDYYITSKEAHAWAMTIDGEIIDLTPTTIAENKEESNVIDAIISWGIKNNIPLYAIGILIVLIIKALFGKKIKLHWKIYNVEKLLTNPETEEAYAQLKDILYGGINIPIKRDITDLADIIGKELSAYSAEELREIKKDLENMKSENNYQTLKLAQKIVDEAPFIKENSEVLKRELAKKNRE